MMFTFDFIDFAEKVAHKYIVKDAWGNEIDIRNVELVLTTSMLKLWACYKSVDHYLECCAANHYTFGIAKVTPRALESMRTTNYQYLQYLKLDDGQIDELIGPTMDEIKAVVGGDYRRTILFLRGLDINSDNAERGADPIPLALMAEPRMIDDPHIKRRVWGMIERRIRDAKIGVLNVHGNYSILCGDPYALCQSMFGLEVTGLLKAGELYNKYWLDAGVPEVACFRAPMTSRNNVKVLSVAANDDMRYWYQYMTTCTMLNAWDTTSQALNGAD